MVFQHWWFSETSVPDTHCSILIEWTWNPTLNYLQTKFCCPYARHHLVATSVLICPIVSGNVQCSCSLYSVIGPNGLFTLHGTGTGTGTGNGTSTIGDNGSSFGPCLSAVWTVNIIYKNPLILVPSPVPVPVPCSVNAPLPGRLNGTWIWILFWGVHNCYLQLPRLRNKNICIQFNSLKSCYPLRKP